MPDILQRAKPVRLLVFDVDGVLTDGSIFISETGEEFKAFNSQDGHGIKMLKASGVEVAIISGRSARCVEARAHNLGIALLYQGVEDKLEVYLELLKKFDFEERATAYVGDDVMDLPVMLRCGLAASVPGAHALVKRRAHYVTRNAAGRGAAREVCELIMRAQGTWESALARYFPVAARARRRPGARK